MLTITLSVELKVKLAKFNFIPNFPKDYLWVINHQMIPPALGEAGIDRSISLWLNHPGSTNPAPSRDRSMY